MKNVSTKGILSVRFGAILHPSKEDRDVGAFPIPAQSQEFKVLLGPGESKEVTLNFEPLESIRQSVSAQHWKGNVYAELGIAEVTFEDSDRYQFDDKSHKSFSRRFDSIRLVTGFLPVARNLTL